MRYLFFIGIFWLPLSGLAQEKPEFFPEETIGFNEFVKCYCSPGIYNKSRSKGLELAYTFVSQTRYRDEAEPPYGARSDLQNFQNFLFNLKVPLVNKENFKFLIGYKFQEEKYHFSNIENDGQGILADLDQQRLKNSAFSIIVSNPLNETRYLGFRLRYSANGNFQGLMNFGSEYNVWQFLGLYGIEVHDDFEWGFGLALSKSFRRTSILPFIMYNRNFSNHYGIEATFPAALYLRYNYDQKNILLFGYEYGSQSYLLRFSETLPSPSEFAYNHSEVALSLRYERRIAPWVWGNLKMGYLFNFNTDFEARSTGVLSFQLDPSDNFYFHLGVFISPPRS